MTEAETIEEVRAANQALASMRDKGARWWTFWVSHTTFDMVIGEPLGKDNVALCLPGCAYLAGPVSWPNQQIEIATSPRGIVIQDPSVGFRAEGGWAFRWRRNYDLMSYHGIWGARTASSQMTLEEISNALKQIVQEYYDGKVGCDDVAYSVGSFLWYKLPVVNRNG
jgi:hypothetical protein